MNSFGIFKWNNGDAYEGEMINGKNAWKWKI